jgi:hypothetical protein
MSAGQRAAPQGQGRDIQVVANLVQLRQAKDVAIPTPPSLMQRRSWPCGWSRDGLWLGSSSSSHDPKMEGVSCDDAFLLISAHHCQSRPLSQPLAPRSLLLPIAACHGSLRPTTASHSPLQPLRTPHGPWQPLAAHISPWNSPYFDDFVDSCKDPVTPHGPSQPLMAPRSSHSPPSLPLPAPR